MKQKRFLLFDSFTGFNEQNKIILFWIVEKNF